MIDLKVLIVKIKSKIHNLIYNFFVKYFLPKHKLTVGEYIADLAGQKYKIEATYYDINLKPLIIAINEDGQFRSFPIVEIQKIKEKK